MLKQKLYFFITIAVLVLIMATAAQAGHGGQGGNDDVDITGPIGGMCLTAGSAYTITWTQGSNVDHIELFYSPTGGLANKSSILHPSAQSQTALSWFVPNDDTTDAELYIEGHTDGEAILNTGFSGIFSVKPNCSADTTPPAIGPGPDAINITENSVTITWTTDEPATSQVKYGISSIEEFSTIDDTTLVTSHSVSIHGLSPGTTYQYRPIYRDAAGNLPNIGTYMFTTTGSAADTTAPVISNVHTVYTYSDNTQITWTTDDPSDSAVRYGTIPGSYDVFSSFGCDAGGNVTEHCIYLSGLTADTTYYYKVESRNTSDIYAEDGGHSFVTSSNSIATGSGPTISNVTASNITDHGATISWTTDFDATSKVYYGVDLFSSQLESSDSLFSTSHSITLSGLSAGTIYEYFVESAYDTTNVSYYPYDEGSGSFIMLTFTTLGVGDTVTPDPDDTTSPVISNVQAINIFGDGAQIEWITDEPADSKVEYGTSIDSYPFISDWRCDAGGYVTNHCINLIGLAFDATYYYRVTSIDPSGNTATSPEHLFTSSSGDSGGGMHPGGGGDAFWVDFFSTFPQEGDIGIGTNSYVQVGFNKDVDPVSVNDQSFSLSLIVTPEVRVAGVFTVLANGFGFTPSVPLDPDTTYVYIVSTAIKALDSTSLFEPFTVSFTTASGSIAEAAQVTGKVTDAAGNPIKEAFVEVHTADWTLSRGSGTDVNGEYTVFNIPPGTYVIDVFPPQGTSGLLSPPSFNVTFAAGEVKTYDFQFTKAAKIIKGVVKRTSGIVVTDAFVNAFQQSTNKHADTQVGSQGNYTLSVSGGSWEVSVWPSGPSADWSYNKEPQLVVFADDTTLEEKILDFIVVSTDATVKGKVLLPDGTPPPAFTVFGGFRSSDGAEFGGPIGADGTFSVRVTAGTYTAFIHTQDPTLTAPDIPLITVVTGGVVDLGIIQLTQKSDHITGIVADEKGIGVSGVRVSAWKPDGFDYAESKTDADGVFTLFVTPGKWEVVAEPPAALNFYNPDPPKRITVESGVTAIVNFRLLPADASISGTVVDKAGNVLSSLYGFADLSQSTGFEFGPGIGGSIDRGQFSFKAPAGTYQLRVFLPPDTPYTAGEPQTVILEAGKTTSVKVVVLENSSIIKGFFHDEAGTVVTGFDAHVFATSKEGSWQEALFDKTTGTYTLKVSAGTWYLGYDIDPASGFISGHEPNVKVVIAEGETLQQNFIVKKAGSLITGVVTDPEGKGVFGAFIGISKTGFASAIESEEFKDPTVAGTETDANGFYTVAVPAGTYFVKTFVNPERGFINSKEKSITIADGETATLNLQLRTADLAITGVVFVNDAGVTDAFVWGWSETGGYQESFTHIDGSYQLNVTSEDSWVVAATTDFDGVLYRANEVSISVGTTSVTHDIYLERIQELPPSVVETSDATTPTVASVTGGATVVASGNAISTTGSVSISITPDTRTPSQGEVKVIGTAYDLEARDATGQLITSFNTDITVTIPYEEQDVVLLGAKESNLVMSFWEETAATWKILENSIVNQEENTVTAAVDHFTRFAIVAAADITPPEAPTAVSGIALGAGEIKLSWSNPTADFSHAKIYRSEEEGALGAVLTSEVVGEEYTDDTVIDGMHYYYTIRAVDPAGNETSNTNQVQVVAIGTGVKKVEEDPLSAPPVKEKTPLPPGQTVKLEILRNLTVGSSGDDVTALQQLLLDEGVYPEGLITGYFGSLTKQAVIRFQEKYADEVLTPVGLSKGSGFVGSSSRKKVNELLSP